MSDRDRLQVYLVLRQLRFCTASEVARHAGVAPAEVTYALAELAGEGLVTERAWGAPQGVHYIINDRQADILAQKAATLVVQLRGAP